MYRKILATALISIQSLVPVYAASGDPQFFYRSQPQLISPAGSGGTLPETPIPGDGGNVETLNLTASAASLTLDTGASVQSGVVATVTASKDIDNTAWQVVGDLPPGITATPSGKVMTFAGKATKGGVYNVTVNATAGQAGSASAAVAFNVKAFELNNVAISAAKKRADFSFDLATLIDQSSFAGVNAQDITWQWAAETGSSVTMPGLPAGLSLDGSTISGKPYNSGTYGILLTAQAGNTSRTKSVKFAIDLQNTKLELADATLPVGEIAASYSYDMAPLLTPTNIRADDVVWSAVGSSSNSGQVSGLPAGVTLSTAGKLSGKPTSAGVYAFDVTATFDDVNEQAEHVTATKSYTITSNGTAELSKIDIGDYHSCAITPAGGVKCWGLNGNGQLGNGTGTASNTPVDVTGLTSGVKALAVGSYHTCAIMTAGNVKCWGSNTQGQLGNGNTSSSNVPVNVLNITNAVQISAADGNGANGHTCATLSTGAVKCWGSNGAGQLGNGTTVNSSVPVDVNLGTTATLVALGSSQSCAITKAATVKCWGSGTSGQLGNGANANSSNPVDVKNLTGVVAVKGGGDNTSKIATCAVTGSGALMCWGSNSDGQLGNGTNTNSNVPMAVNGLGSGVVSVALGNRHACAALASGGVKCWGWGANGQLGNGSTATSNNPVQVSGLSSGITAIAAGYQHSCAIAASGAVQCWGANGNGQLGNGTNTQSTTPVTVVASK